MSGLREQVEAVVDPELGRDLGHLGFVRSVEGATVRLAMPGTDWPTRRDIEAAVSAVAPGVSIEVAAMDESELVALRTYLRAEMVAPEGHRHGHDHGAARPRFLDPASKTRVLGISSGKGGVGKSSVTANLAISLAQAGQAVGVLDADVYGFSLPKMLGGDAEPVILGDTVVPTLVHGVHSLSMGYFVPDEQPVIWRGPMLHKAVEQLVTEAWWDEPDFLLIDMPPGTGDVALTLSEVVPKVEMYVVTTPQVAAQRVAQRSAFAARKLKLALRGVIENMSYFVGPDGQRHEIFGSGGGERLAAELGVPLLAQIPLDPKLREGGDTGHPVVVTDRDGESARAFADLARRVIAQGPARVYRQELRLH